MVTAFYSDLVIKVEARRIQDVYFHDFIENPPYFQFYIES